MDAHDAPLADLNRTQARESIFLSASVTFETQSSAVTVRVRNISSGGMMVDSSHPVAPGSALVADIKNVGRVKGRVAWCTDNRMGIAFDREIDPRTARVKVGGDSREPIYAKPPTPGRRPGITLR
jgi:hypothetical protein